jgi:hypothetical protein
MKTDLAYFKSFKFDDLLNKKLGTFNCKYISEYCTILLLFLFNFLMTCCWCWCIFSYVYDMLNALCDIVIG